MVVLNERVHAFVPAIALLIAGCVSAPNPLSHGEPLPTTAGWSIRLPAFGSQSLAVSEDGATLALAILEGGKKQGTLTVIEASQGRVRFNYSYTYDMCCTFPPVDLDASGDRVLVGGNALHLLDAGTGEVLVSYDLPRDRPKFPEVPVNVDLSRDGTLAVAPTWQANQLVALTPGRAPLWETEYAPGDVFGDARLSPDGQTVVVGTPTRVSVYEAATGKELVSHPTSGAKSGPSSVAVNQDGSRIAALAVVQGQLSVIVYDRGSQRTDWSHLLATEQWMGGVRMTPDGRFVAAWSPGQSYVFDETGQIVAALGTDQRIVAFAPLDVGALLLVDRGEVLEIFHIGAGPPRSHGTLAFKEYSAALVAGGVVTATTEWEAGKPTGTRLDYFIVPHLPAWPGGAHHEP